MFILHIEFSVDLVRINAQMMFKHDLDHLSLDPGLVWTFEKSAQTHNLRGRHCNHSGVLCMIKNKSRVAWLCYNTSLHVVHTL